MGFFRKLFGKKQAPPPPKAAPPADDGDDASAKDVVRHVFDELAKGRSHDQIRADLVAQGLSKKTPTTLSTWSKRPCSNGADAPSQRLPEPDRTEEL